MATTKRVNRESEQTVGVIPITRFSMLIVGTLISASGAYSGPIEDRLIVIDTIQGQSSPLKVFDGLAVVSISTGMLTLADSDVRQ